MALDPALVAPSKTAVIINECQRGVVGDLSGIPMLVELAPDMLKAVDRLVRAARAAGAQVVHCVVKGREDGKGSNQNHRFAGVARKQREAGIKGPDPELHAQVVDAISVDPTDILMTRIHGMSPMFDTGLDPILRNLGISTVVVGGVSLNVGVTNLAFDAMNRGYEVVVPRDASVGVPKEYGEAIMANTMPIVARLTTVDELVGIWSK